MSAMGTLDCDVAVVGAGPAGASCALHLARAGLRALVLEKAVPPRYKTCGGGLVGRALREIEVGLDAVVEAECRAAEMSPSHDGPSIRVVRDEPIVLTTMRADLDQRLLAAALEAGSELEAPRELKGLQRAGEVLTIETERGPLRARYVVAADGALSRTARAAGWGPGPRDIPAIEWELRVAARERERFAGCARFDFGAIEGGYAWVFPKHEHLSVGCLSTRRRARDLRRALEGYLARLDLVGEREEHGFVIPLAPRAATLARDGVLLVGDAAGLVDPVTCEGISFALSSGRLAAESIVRARAGGREACREYASALARTILPELSAARGLARLLHGHPRLRAAAFSRAGRALCEAATDVVAGRSTYRALLRRPRSWLKLLALGLQPPALGAVTPQSGRAGARGGF